MDHSWFRLDSPPFDDRADGRLFQSTTDREAVLETLMQHAQFGKGVALLTADAGLGKTMLLRALLLRLHATDHAVLLPWSAGSDRDVIRETCKRFGVGLPFSKDRARTFRRLRAHLRKTWEVGHRSILMIDQAENLTAHHMSCLAEFVTGSQDDAESLRIVLSGRPTLLRVLDRPEFASFRQQIVTTCRLNAMTAGETKEYIRARLLTAGHSTGDLFESEAVNLIHTMSGGVPRLVNAAAVRAMQAARFAGEKRIRAVRIGAVSTGTPAVAPTSAEAVAAPRSSAAAAVSSTSHGVVGVSKPATAGRTHPAPLRASHGVFGAGSMISPSSGDDELRPSLIGELGREIADYTAHQFRSEGSPVPTAASGAADIVQRLEQLVQRAEYAIGALDGSVRESLVAGERLSFVRDRVERLTAELTASADRATETVSTVHLRAEEVIDETDRRVTEVRGRIAGVLETLAESEPFQRMQRMGARLDELEGRLDAFADDLARRADEQIKRVAALNEGVDRAAALEQRLETMLARVESAAPQLDEYWQRFNTESERTRKSVEAAHRTLIEESRTAARDARAELADATAELKRQATGLHTKIEEAKRLAGELERESIARVIENVRETADVETRRAEQEFQRLNESARAEAEKLNRSVSDAQNLFQQVQHESAGACEKVREQIARWREESSELMAYSAEAQRTLNARVAELSTEGKKQAESWSARIRQLRELAGATESEVVEAIEKAQGEVTRLGEELAADLVTRIESKKEETEQSIGEWSSRIEALRTLAAAGQAQVAEIIDGARREFVELTGERLRQVDELQHYLTALDGRHGHLQFKVSELNETANDLAAKIGQWESAVAGPSEALATWVHRGETVIRELSTTVHRAEDLQAGTKESIGRLETLRHAVSSTLVDLGAAHERVRPLVEALADAEGHTDTINTACATAHEIERRMTTLVDAAKRQHEALDMAGTRADEKSRKLDSHHAAASQTLRQLAEATIQGQSVIGQMAEMAGDAEGKAERARVQIETWSREVRSLTATVESRVVELNAATARSDDALRKIAELAAQRDTLQHTLSEQTRMADEHVRRIQEHTRQSAALAEKLSEVGTFLQRAQDTQQALRQSLADAAQVHTDLAAAGAGGAAQCNELQRVTAEAQTLVEAQRDILRRIEEAVSGWDERLSDGRSTVEAAERLQREFSSQAEDLSAKLDAMRRIVAQVEEKVTSIVTRPNEVIAVAQNQAAQLERVCGVVRKVFAGLSQTSLEAVKKTKEFQQVSEAATKRLAALHHETDRATSTLHEWVAEAVRVQARLEKLLQQSPSISATHPGEALLAVSQRLQSPDTDAAARVIASLVGARPDGELRTLPESPATRPVSTAAKGVTPSFPAIPEDRVSTMIEEAKEAAMVGSVS